MYWSKNNCGEIHVFQGLDLAFTSDWPIILSHGRLIRTSCSGGSRGGTPLFLDQTEAQRAEKFWGGDRNPCPLSKGLDDQPPNSAPQLISRSRFSTDMFMGKTIAVKVFKKIESTWFVQSWKVLNFSGHLNKSLNSVKVNEKYLISLLELKKSLKFTCLFMAHHCLWN